MALSPLVLPFQKTNYVRNAWDFYKYEVAAYEKSSNDIFIGKDDVHQLLLLRKLDSFTPSIEEYPNIINFLQVKKQDFLMKIFANIRRFYLVTKWKL